MMCLFFESQSWFLFSSIFQLCKDKESSVGEDEETLELLMKEVERIKGFSFKHDNLLKVSELTEQISESALQIFLSTSRFWPR